MKLYRRNMVAMSAYQRAYTTWYKRLPVTQQAAVYHYTDAGYRSLNHCLRYGKPLSPADEAMQELLSAALAAAPPDERSRTLYRGVRKLAARPAVGAHITYPFFLSTTSDPHQIFKFTTPDEPIIYEIDTPLGVEISDIHPEFEFLLPTNITFEVVDVLTNVAWHAEYPDTDYSRALTDATVIRMRQINDDTPRQKTGEPAR